ncbi:hypothetical protein [Brevundimonas sp.]|uniref:hypothetical protein n=1 Tax=Brevundimonas sp. TaxID=1871086 RepID=UPI003F6E7D12
MAGSGDGGKPYTVPGPPPEWLESQDWLTDPFARIEERTFPRADTLPGQIEQNKLLIQKAFGFCMPVSIILAFAIFWLAVCVYAWHMLAWGWTWLSPHEMDDLKSVLFSGAVGAVVAEGARRYLKPDDKA